MSEAVATEGAAPRSRGAGNAERAAETVALASLAGAAMFAQSGSLSPRAQWILGAAVALGAALAWLGLTRRPARGDIRLAARRRSAWAAATVASCAVAAHGLAFRTGWDVRPVAALGLASVATLAWMAATRSATLLARRQAPPAPRPGEERLVALGELSRVVAHGVRNSLSVVYSCASLLERDRPAEQRAEIVRSLAEEADKVRTLVDQLSAFASAAEPSRWPLALSDVAREAAGRARAHAAWPRGLEVALDPAVGDDGIRGDALLLETAFVQLLVLAASSGPERVRVTIGGGDGGSVRTTIVGEGGRLDDAALRAAEAALGDTLEPEHLWLAVARRVVRAHQGALRFARSERGEAQAVVELPASQ